MIGWRLQSRKVSRLSSHNIGIYTTIPFVLAIWSMHINLPYVLKVSYDPYQQQLSTSVPVERGLNQTLLIASASSVGLTMTYE